MLITKFNRMIRSRLLWTVFALFISFSFLATFTQQGGCNPSAATPAIAEYNGEKITSELFNQARVFEAGFRSRPDVSAEELEKQTWNRIVALRLAAKLGMSATDQEIATIKANTPEFQTDGVYDEGKYRVTVETRFQVPVTVYEEYVRQQLTLTKLRGMSAAFAWTSPAEINSKLTKLTDMFTVEYAVITNNGKSAHVEIQDKDANDYFIAHPKEFQIPEKVQVAYFAFPYTNYFASITIESNEVTEFYEDHISEFTRKSTNDQTEAIPLAEAWTNILDGLTFHRAATLAHDDAVDFSVALTPDKDDSTPDPDMIAKEKNISSIETPLFTMNDQVPGVEDAGQAFNKAAFELFPKDPERRISDVVVGKENTYVLVAKVRQPSRMPSFDEARAQAIALAREDQARKEFRKKAAELLESARKEIAAGKSLSQALANAGLTTSTMGPFSVFSEMTNDTEYSEAIVSSALRLDKGEMAELIPVDNGFLLLHVSERKPGDPLSAEEYRGELLNALNTYRGNTVFQEWQTTASRSLKRLYQAQTNDVEDASSDDSETGKPSDSKEL